MLAIFSPVPAAVDKCCNYKQRNTPALQCVTPQAVERSKALAKASFAG